MIATKPHSKCLRPCRKGGNTTLRTTRQRAPLRPIRSNRLISGSDEQHGRRRVAEYRCAACASAQCERGRAPSKVLLRPASVRDLGPQQRCSYWVGKGSCFSGANRTGTSVVTIPTISILLRGSREFVAHIWLVGFIDSARNIHGRVRGRAVTDG